MNDPLAHEPFSFQVLKNGSVRIYHGGRLVTTLAPKEGVKFEQKVNGLAPSAQQQLMARATGQFKFGNEKIAKRQMSERLED